MANEKVTPILYVCANAGCTYSGATVGANVSDKPYGVVSAKPGEPAKCPVCGAVCSTVEDGRHKFLRLNSQRIGAVRDKMRLIGNTMKGAQYEPAQDDLKRVRAVLYAEFDRLGKLIDAREEKILNPGVKTAKAKVKRNTFAL